MTDLEPFAIRVVHHNNIYSVNQLDALIVLAPIVRCLISLAPETTGRLLRNATRETVNHGTTTIRE